ncbi:hypothetical protein O181_129324 [Austropuccinia psidii MF-1]|uniref:Uncharacterized protein n=1 Tax=Austropuccinia psidii MF-1 TaxID=1389203 RepID=A0A9Q3Q8Z9_9BASI|nr:hypothetical protein [Austropuccinia psidii MF-1]
MLADKHTRNVCLLSAPSDHKARGVLAQDALARTPLCDYPADEGWRWREVIQNLANRHHVLSPMGFKHQKQNPLTPPQQDSPIPSLPGEQTPWQLTPGPSGTQWSEELFCEPSRAKEPPIPGPSPSSQPPEDNTTREPEPEVAPMQLTEEPFACPATTCSIIIINNTPIGSLPVPPRTPVQSPSHSHDDARQEFTDLQTALMIPEPSSMNRSTKSYWSIAACST